MVLGLKSKIPGSKVIEGHIRELYPSGRELLRGLDGQNIAWTPEKIAIKNSIEDMRFYIKTVTIGNPNVSHTYTLFGSIILARTADWLLKKQLTNEKSAYDQIEQRITEGTQDVAVVISEYHYNQRPDHREGVALKLGPMLSSVHEVYLDEATNYEGQTHKLGVTLLGATASVVESRLRAAA